MRLYINVIKKSLIECGSKLVRKCGVILKSTICVKKSTGTLHGVGRSSDIKRAKSKKRPTRFGMVLSDL